MQPKQERRPFGQVLSEYIISEGPKIFFVIAWIVINVIYVGYSVLFYSIGNGAVYTQALGPQFVVARAAGAGIAINSTLVLLMVLRNFLSWLRGTFLGNYLPIDKNIVFHRYIAWTIAIYTFLHCIGHFINFLQVERASPAVQAVAIYIPAGSTAVPTTYSLSFNTLAGITGYIICVIMILMYTSALRYIRSPMFNVFWFTHHLFIFYYVLTCFHAILSVVQRTTFYAFVVGPIVFYAIERTVRIFRGNQDTILLLAVAHPSRVLELQLKKSAFVYKPGQYLFLNCPYIASQEWHPFTISSAPEEEFVSIHIRIVGDWTNDLWAFMNPNKKIGIIQENVTSAPDGSPIFRIDGPFGSASEEVFNFRSVMLIGGGIGVTPFGSILKHISFKIKMNGQNLLEKVYFYWISRDKNAFEWFNEVLAALENENIGNFLEISTYLTGQLSVDQIRGVVSDLDAPADPITQLQSPTYFGRPNWDQIFQEKAQRHRGQMVGVFFCGPAVLSKQLSRFCGKYTDASSRTIFKYHKENF